MFILLKFLPYKEKELLPKASPITASGHSTSHTVLRDELVHHLEIQPDTELSARISKGFLCATIATNLLTFLETVTGCVDYKSNVDTVYLLDLAKVSDNSDLT